MANISQEKDLEMLKKNADGTFTKYNPKTKATNVVCSNGTTVESHMADKANVIETPIIKKISAKELNNTLLKSGFYTNSGDGLLNKDETPFLDGWWHIQVSYHGPDGFGMQVATPLANDAYSRYYRTSHTTNWGPWRKILDQRDYDKLFQYANDGKTKITNVVGSPLLATDTFQQQTDKIQVLKNTFATTLANKGQACTGSENLNNLINKIININTGKKFASGQFNLDDNTNSVWVNWLDFAPSFAFVKIGGALFAMNSDIITAFNGHSFGEGGIAPITYRRRSTGFDFLFLDSTIFFKGTSVIYQAYE